MSYGCYNDLMIITKTTPFTKEEIEKLREEYDFFIKTVIDIKKKICSAGAHMHVENEQILLKNGSKQEDLWGGGIELETGSTLYNSFINIRPTQKNTSNEIQDERIRRKFDEVTKYFFSKI
jgi:hypothetical protein